MKNISILGATGSVGVSTLDVIQQHPDLFSVVALTTNENIDLLFEQCVQFRPKLVVVANQSLLDELVKKFAEIEDYKPEFETGQRGLELAASFAETDCVMAAIVGAAGLPATLAAARAGKHILLANKEALVMSGDLLMELASQNNSKILPIDSEHNAVFQCLPMDAVDALPCKIDKIILTASGGPFLDTPLSDFESITPEQACAHPNWEMGKKISVDSATMMNKGLELIEACKLFDVNVKDVEIVIHPQSIVHSLVAYPDGSVLAHMAYPDMRVPIAHALAWPQRITSGVDVLDLTELGALEFRKPDHERFPCLQLAYDALHAEQSATTVLNAANEVAVDSFLNNKIRFTDISSVINATLQDIDHVKVDELDIIYEKDRQAREFASRYISGSISRN